MKTRQAVTTLLLACAGHAAGQSAYPSLGRLFTTPAERMQLDRQRISGPAPGTVPAQPAQPVAPPPPPEPVSSAPSVPPEPVKLTGVIRRGNGEATVFFGDQMRGQRLPAVAPGAPIPVDVGGREVLLKPGQSIDPVNGTIQDVR